MVISKVSITSMLDEMEKIGGSALRKAFSLVPEVVGYTHKSEPVVRWGASVGSKPVGTMITHGNRVGVVALEDAFRGMGLGKKMYGEVMRRMPEQALHSDSSVSDSARRVWKGMKERPGYKVEEPLLGKPFARLGDQTYSMRSQFKGSLPPESAIDPNLPRVSQATKEKMVNNAKAERREELLGTFGLPAAFLGIGGAATAIMAGRKKENQ